MKRVNDFTEIFIHKGIVDGRKLINGLAAIAQSTMPVPPCNGALFVFMSRRKDTIRCLYWDRTGFALWVKRLEKHRFIWPRKFSGDVFTVTPQQLEWLLDGLDITRIKPHESLYFSAVS